MFKLLCFTLVLLTYDSKAIEFDYTYDRDPLTTPSSSAQVDPLPTTETSTASYDKTKTTDTNTGVDLFKGLKGLMQVML